MSIEKTVYITKAEYARHRGVSAKTITKHAQNHTIATNEQGLVDRDFSDFLLDNYTKSLIENPKASQEHRKRGEPDPLIAAKIANMDNSYLKARADLTRSKADQAELELQVARGTYVSKTSTDKAGFECARHTRDAVMSVPDRVGALLAAEESILEVKRILTEELTKALEDVISFLAEGEE